MVQKATSPRSSRCDGVDGHCGRVYCGRDLGDLGCDGRGRCIGVGQCGGDDGHGGCCGGDCHCCCGGGGCYLLVVIVMTKVGCRGGCVDGRGECCDGGPMVNVTVVVEVVCHSG